MPSSSKIQTLDPTDARRSFALSGTYYPVSRRQYPGRMESSATSSLKPQHYQLYTQYKLCNVEYPNPRALYTSTTCFFNEVSSSAGVTELFLFN